ncbi:hypothetical protein C0Q70_01271 [Pomacea canaliculata]|uniref:G-protein coupled receptors family 1 profile domain-containing protein n=1 Tax=Pomacea canaliculata TaxID=400727 RepID=A0A2T7PYZ7_POMCA|nr:hypothetical protein C0Q70_01271 [Pomacea canaliculata]
MPRTYGPTSSLTEPPHPLSADTRPYSPLSRRCHRMLEQNSHFFKDQTNKRNASFFMEVRRPSEYSDCCTQHHCHPTVAGWQLGEFMCKAAPYLQGVSVCASVNTLATIALDRWALTLHSSSFSSIVIVVVEMFLSTHYH